MSNRNSALVLIGALASCFVLFVCAGLVVGGFYFFNSGVNPIAALRAPAARDQIAFIGNDLNLYVADAANGTTTALTHDGGTEHVYNFPTWSPDNHRLAFVGYAFENGAPKEGTLYTISPTGENLTPVYKTPENFPFYLYWSPDNQIISFLANKDAQTIALNVARADQPDSKQEVDSGAPFYWAWSPDGSKMLTHVGGTRSESDDARLALLTFNNNVKESLPAAPGQFQAPQWSANGKILFSTQDEAGQSIALSDADGTQIKKLATYRGRASFALSPDGAQVAYILTDTNSRLPHLGAVRVVSANGENTHIVSQTDPALAFLWSPDSTKLAYLTATVSQQNQSNFNFRALPPLASTAPEKFLDAPNMNQGGQLQLLLTWNVWERATDASHAVASFVPTGSFLSVLPYFDQYANSSTFWSPDSQALVYTARDAENTGSVYIADAVGNQPPRKIGDGLIAFWSWK